MMPKSDALTFYRGAPRRWEELARAALESGVSAAPAVVAAGRDAAEAEAGRVAEELERWLRPGEAGADAYATVVAEIGHIPGDVWPERGGPATAGVDRIAGLLRAARDQLERLGVTVEE